MNWTNTQAQADYGGDDFILAYDNITQDATESHPLKIQIGDTFMHELGHNLGLGENYTDTDSCINDDTPQYKFTYGTDWERQSFNLYWVKHDWY